MKGLLTEDDLRSSLRGRLGDAPGGKAALAQTLGIGGMKLTRVLRGQHPVCDHVAEQLGFRRVTLFEPIKP
jgi:hypothetical protein